MKHPWGVRLRMWLAAAILAIGIVKHRPLVAIGLVLLLAISALATYLKP